MSGESAVWTWRKQFPHSHKIQRNFYFRCDSAHNQAHPRGVMASSASFSMPAKLEGNPGDSSAVANAQANAMSTPIARKNPKDMTKAERREMQERQRAAKASNLSSGGKGSSKGTGKDATATPKRPPNSSDTPKAINAHSHSTPIKQAKDVAHAQSSGNMQHTQLQQSESRGLRIFAHFGLTKPPSNAKGDAQQIHPAIVRLGLQFAAFKIVGANARCIATLTAMKNVGSAKFRSIKKTDLSCMQPAGHPRLHNASSHDACTTSNLSHLTTDIAYCGRTTNGCEHGCCDQTAKT